MKPEISHVRRWEVWKTSETNFWLEVAAGRQSFKGFQECIATFTGTRAQAEQIYKLYNPGKQ